MTQPSLAELYQRNELCFTPPDVLRTRLEGARQGYSYWGAVAISLEEWERRGELEIGDLDCEKLGIKPVSIGDEVSIDDVHLLTFRRDYATRSWVFLDSDQPESHHRLMWKLVLESELDFKFTLIWIMQDQIGILFPDMASVGNLL